MKYLKYTTLTFILLLTSSFAIAQGDGQIVDKVVAVVGDNIVLHSEVESQILQAKQQGMTDNIETRCVVIEEMLFQKLMLNKAQYDSIEVSAAQINGEMDQRLNYFISQVGSIEKLEEIYGKSIEQIKAELYDALEEQLMAQQVQQSIVANVKVTPAEVRKFYASIPQDSLPYISSQVEMAQIVIYPKVTKEARQALIKKMTDIRNDIVEKGRSFKTMAILHSQDNSSSEGGDLGWINRTDLVPEFAAAAFALKPNEVSGIVETQFGFHIIQMIERLGERIHVRHILMSPEIGAAEQEAAIARLEEIRNDIMNTDTLSFEKAAELYSEDEETAKGNGLITSPYDGGIRFSMDQLDQDLFIAIDDLEPGQISEPYRFKSRTALGYRIVKLNRRTEPHVANLVDDYDLISRVALNDKKQKAMNKWIADQVGKTYIRLDDAYTDCNFTYGWVKAQ